MVDFMGKGKWQTLMGKDSMRKNNGRGLCGTKHKRSVGRRWEALPPLERTALLLKCFLQREAERIGQELVGVRFTAKELSRAMDAQMGIVSWYDSFEEVVYICHKPRGVNVQ